jgi:hypothetical protein
MAKPRRCFRGSVPKETRSAGLQGIDSPIRRSNANSSSMIIEACESFRIRRPAGPRQRTPTVPMSADPRASRHEQQGAGAFHRARGYRASRLSIPPVAPQSRLGAAKSARAALYARKISDNPAWGVARSIRA